MNCSSLLFMQFSFNKCIILSFLFCRFVCMLFSCISVVHTSSYCILVCCFTFVSKAYQLCLILTGIRCFQFTLKHTYRFLILSINWTCKIHWLVNGNRLFTSQLTKYIDDSQQYFFVSSQLQQCEFSITLAYASERNQTYVNLLTDNSSSVLAEYCYSVLQQTHLGDEAIGW